MARTPWRDARHEQEHTHGGHPSTMQPTERQCDSPYLSGFSEVLIAGGIDTKHTRRDTKERAEGRHCAESKMGYTALRVWKGGRAGGRAEGGQAKASDENEGLTDEASHYPATAG